MKLQQNIKAFIRPGEQQGYVAECLEISVVTQGETLDEVANNLLEAVSLHLEGEEPAEFGLVANPSLLVTFELQQSYLSCEPALQIPDFLKKSGISPSLII
ncbi:MAG: type II toxin-antitoxin system HicB family antitoxin [Cyanobacteriota bacterium]